MLRGPQRGNRSFSPADNHLLPWVLVKRDEHEQTTTGATRERLQGGAHRRGQVARNDALRSAQAVGHRRLPRLDDTESVPNTFLLVFDSGEASRQCRVVWRNARQLGVRFELAFRRR